MAADPPPRRRAVAAAVVVTALALVAVLGWQLLDARAQTADRDQRVAVATDFALALLAYDHADLDASLDAVAAVSTDDFAADYRDRFTAELAGPIRELEAVASAEVTEVFLAADPPQASATAVARTRAVVGAEVEVVTDGQPRPSAPRLELELVRTEAGWRVDDAGGAGRADLPAPGAAPADP